MADDADQLKELLAIVRSLTIAVSNAEVQRKQNFIAVTEGIEHLHAQLNYRGGLDDRR